MSTKAILEQLNQFGYNEKEIKNAIHSVNNKYDINEIQDYIDSNKSVQPSESAATSLGTTTGNLNISRFDKLRAMGNEKKIDLVNGYIRAIQDMFPNDLIFYIIPMAINQYTCLFYIEFVRQIRWNNVYYTRSKLSLEDDLKLCRHEVSSGYANVSADIEPITNGIHCFRVLARSASRNTLFFSFMRYGEHNEYAYRSFYQAQLYGTTTHGYIVINGTNKNEGLCNPAAEYQLDLLIDCEQKQIKMRQTSQIINSVNGRFRKTHKITCLC